MELRKQKEIEHYDKKSREQAAGDRGDFEGFNPFLLSSYNFLKERICEIAKGRKVLDYGCGNGVHDNWLAECSGKVVAIDLSEESLKIARKRVKRNNVEFLNMDCENLTFESDSFDIVFDGGTFSSLDLTKAFFEITRVLRPNGYLIGIETFGHNPLTNLNRLINKKTGKRTEWAVSHIFKAKDIETAKKFFKETEVYYFHIISWLAIPFLKYPGGKLLLKVLEAADYLLRPFFKKYSFKIVFIFKNKPNKHI
jgi:ubiquinone/menaquinone biosynthesis C-methylase UbiE